MNNIYERVRELAKKRGLSLQTVAEKAGIGINSIYRWRHATPKLDTVEKVAHALNVSSDYLLTGNQAQNIKIWTMKTRSCYTGAKC